MLGATKRHMVCRGNLKKSRRRRSAQLPIDWCKEQSSGRTSLLRHVVFLNWNMLGEKFLTSTLLWLTQQILTLRYPGEVESTPSPGPGWQSRRKKPRLGRVNIGWLLGIRQRRWVGFGRELRQVPCVFTAKGTEEGEPPNLKIKN